MLEAFGIFLLWTVIGASVGTLIGFAVFLLVELRDSMRELKASRRG